MMCANCCLRNGQFGCNASAAGSEGLMKHGIFHECHDNEARVKVLRMQLGEIEDWTRPWTTSFVNKRFYTRVKTFYCRAWHLHNNKTEEVSYGI
jgi:hypothetical protein